MTESDPHARVAIVTKSHLVESNTVYAQGGISAVWEESDTVEAHTRDTMIAGGFLNDEAVVEAVCREGPMRVAELIQWGTKFDKEVNSDTYHLAKEVWKRLAVGVRVGSCKTIRHCTYLLDNRAGTVQGAFSTPQMPRARRLFERWCTSARLPPKLLFLSTI